MSTDFHPTKLGLLSSCDTSNDIRLWDVSRGECDLIFKVGGSSSFLFLKIFIKRFLYLIKRLHNLIFNFLLCFHFNLEIT